MPRLSVFLDPGARQEEDVLLLSERESHHLVRVLRARSGDELLALDGRGTVFSAVLDTADSRQARLRVLHQTSAPRPPPPVHLAFGIPKGKALEAILKGAVELGCESIQPVIPHHVEGRPEDKKKKWTQLLREAAKQSRNPWLPELQPLCPFEAFCHQPFPDPSLRIVASLEKNARPIADVLQKTDLPPSTPIWLAIGPEGDFSPAEYAAFHQAGFTPVSLGETILRSETAALAILAITRALRFPTPSSPSRSSV